MPLSDDEATEHLRDIYLVDALDLNPEQHTAVATALISLLWLKRICKEENKEIGDISAELVIKKLTGIDVQTDRFALPQANLSAQASNRKRK